MKTADLYIRVSTDEQADKGYSQRNQEEVLLKFCEISKIAVRKVIFEDHSAKSFIRPEWIKLLALLRKQRSKTDLVLFTKWDRFSRNAPDAYQMINTLKVLGVEPQAVEQPLDMSVPENKMMLAIYLTAPEIENDRRSLNVFHGMRRARKEGRFMATAPVGYVNQILEGGLKRIIPKEPQASLIKWAFKEVSDNRYSIEQVWKKAREKGFACNKSTFWLVLRNPVYCGKIIIPKYKEEQTYWVQGLHEPLITEGLFYDVQETLTGRKKRKEGGTKIVSLDQLPLRGFLICSKCHKPVSGSASKGCRQYYHYYHCSASCGYRKRADEVNETFIKGLKDYVLNPVTAELFKSVILDAYQNITKSERIFRKQYIDQITTLSNKSTRARELLLNGDIDSADYREIKNESESTIRILETKISELKSDFLPSGEFNELVEKAINTITNIDVIYCKSDNETKRKIISSMYAKNFTLEDLELRTNDLTEAFKVIYLINSKLCGKKSETADSNLTLSRWVLPTRFELISMVPETIILSVELRERVANILIRG
jgi:site-specific DNA recombinase